MKTNKTVSKAILGLGVAIAMALAAWLPTTASAQDEKKPMKEMKGGEHMMMLNKEVKTTQDAKALKPDDSLAMVCAKCKTVYVTRVKQGTKGAQLLMGPVPTELIGTHECAGCKGTWTITGVGKGATTELKHSCTMCGDDSGFCCATTKDAKPTKGMDKK